MCLMCLWLFFVHVFCVCVCDVLCCCCGEPAQMHDHYFVRTYVSYVVCRFDVINLMVIRSMRMRAHAQANDLYAAVHLISFCNGDDAHRHQCASARCTVDCDCVDSC